VTNKVEVQVRNIVLSEEMQAYVTSKASKIDRHLSLSRRPVLN
jgi:ribosome-associated translation inhibitor RaiA